MEKTVTETKKQPATEPVIKLDESKLLGGVVSGTIVAAGTKTGVKVARGPEMTIAA